MEIWKQLMTVVLPVFMIWLMGILINLARVYAVKVEDETFRAWLLDLVNAVEQMIPGPFSGAEKLVAVQKLAPNATREDIEAAVKTMKNVENIAKSV